jgi:hypothetical protein
MSTSARRWRASCVSCLQLPGLVFEWLLQALQLLPDLIMIGDAAQVLKKYQEYQEYQEYLEYLEYQEYLEYMEIMHTFYYSFYFLVSFYSLSGALDSRI